MSRDIAHAQWRFSIVPVGTWGLRHNISVSVRDRHLDPMEHQSEMTYWDSNGHVTDGVTWPRKVKVMTPICLGHYLENGWRYTPGFKGPLIGNDPLDFEWSRDWWCHVTEKGQGHDPDIFGVYYLDNGWRYGLGVNEAPIGNGYLGIKWSRDRWRHVTLKGQGRDPNMLRAQYLVNGLRYRLGTNGPPIGNGPLWFEWSRDWWHHVTQKGQDHDPDIFSCNQNWQ